MKKMLTRLRNFIVSRFNSFKFAFKGWAYVLRTQKNAWIHLAATTLVIAVGFGWEYRVMNGRSFFS
jgi:diacylglycerol kinase (ATP)